MTATDQTRAPQARRIAAGAGWSVSEFVCDAGPDDRAFEERHEDVAIAAVLAGSFNYRTHAGAALMHPGAFVLGARGRCYECGHDHGRGDRCVSISYDPGYFDEIASAASGAANYEFRAAALPASAGLAPLAARLALAPDTPDLALEDLVARAAFAVVRTASGYTPPTRRPSSRDEKRIARAMRHVEAHAREPLDLESLAGIAGMSKFHFLRVFAAVAGTSPYRFLLDARLRLAARDIAASDRRIADIAFEAGFGDLSTFNARFKAVFGEPPSAWRARGGAG